MQAYYRLIPVPPTEVQMKKVVRCKEINIMPRRPNKTIVRMSGSQLTSWRPSVLHSFIASDKQKRSQQECVMDALPALVKAGWGVGSGPARTSAGKGRRGFPSQAPVGRSRRLIGQVRLTPPFSVYSWFITHNSIPGEKSAPLEEFPQPREEEEAL